MGRLARRGLGAFTTCAVVTIILAFSLACAAPAHAQQWSITKTASPTTYSAAGVTITYTYTITKLATGIETDLHDITLTDDKLGAITCPTNGIPGTGMGTLVCTATYVTTDADVTNGAITNTATANGQISGDNIPLPTIQASATVTYKSAFNPDQHRTDTQQVIARFLSHRLSLLMSNPDRIQIFRRLPGLLWGSNDTFNTASTATIPFNVAGTTDGPATRMAFSTSLAQLMRAAQAREETNAADQATNRTIAANPLAGPRPTQNTGLPSSVLAYAGPPAVYKAPPPAAPLPGFDVWLEAQYFGVKTDLGGVDNDGRFGILYLGADYLVSPSILVGALVQFDWMNEASAALNSAIGGRGTMAGPYISARLTQNLFFTARAAWGLSNNDVTPFGTYTDGFATDRWLVHAKLTGNWHWDAYRVTPSVAVDYASEHQRAYTDALGIAIPDQTVALGRLSFGPEIARRYFGADGTIYEPLAALVGQWDFVRPDVASLAGLPVSGDAFHAKVQAGLLVRRPGGLAMRLVGSYDGIASSTFQAYGGEFWLSIPLN